MQVLRRWFSHIPCGGRARLAVGAVLALLFLAFSLASSSHAQFPVAQTFTVDSTGDQGIDFDPGDGICDANPDPLVTTCTLRAAIQESNGNPDANNIRFAPNVTTIVPTTPLPPIGFAVDIDGSNNSPRTEIDGSSLPLGPPADGLTVLAQGSFIENLEIKGFSGTGLNMFAPATAGGNLILANGGAGIVVGTGNVGLFQNAVAMNGGPGIRAQAGPVTIQDDSVEQNNGNGIEVVSGSGVNISGGRFFANGGLGIDLNADGVTANDVGDTDTGPNDLQNFPVLNSATTTGTRVQPGQQVVVNGTIDTNAGMVTIRVYDSESCDPSTHGEGSFQIGEQSVSSSGSFTINLPAGVDPATVLTATATDSTGNTSEFSNCITPVLIGADLGVTKTALPGAGPGEFVTAGNVIQYTVAVSNAGPDSALNVVLSDLLPPPSFVTVGSIIPSQGSCGSPDTNGLFSCQLGSIGVNATATIDIRVTPTINSSTNLINQVFGVHSDKTDPVCTLEPAEPGQTDTPTCDGAEAVTHVEPANGDAGGFVASGSTLSTGTTATASDPTVVSLTNNGPTGTEATLTELSCPGGDPLCSSDPNIVGPTVADVGIGGTSAAASPAAAPTPPAPFTATLTYDKSVVPAVKLSAFHVYAGTTRLSGCSRKVSAPCVSSTKLLSGSKDLEVKVALRASAKLRTTTS
jgi:uncharacterized repeat protein (TIGR01451 family)